MTTLFAAEQSALHSFRFPMVPVGSLFTERSERGDADEFPPLSVGKQGVTAQLESVAKSADTSNRKVVRRGDIAINSRSDRRGAAGLSHADGTVSVVYTVLEPGPLIDPVYAHHMMRCVGFQEEYFRHGTGIVDDLWSTRYDRMATIRVPLPPLEEQRRIADFLDRETAEIDAMDAELDRLIETLHERELHLHQTAIDLSGHPMVGLAVVAQVTLGKMLDQKKNVGEPTPYIRAANISKNGSVSLDDVKLMPMSAVERARLGLRKGDSVMIEGGDAGRVAYLSHGLEGLSFQKTVLRIRPRPDVIDGRYLYTALRQAHRSGRIAVDHSVSTIPHFTAEKAERLKIPLPQLNQQRRIVADLDEQTARIDEMIADANRLKQLLAERRSTLITEVVTGVKEVPV